MNKPPQLRLKVLPTCCAPGYPPITLTKLSASAPAILFMADEASLHRKLGVYETRD